MNPDEKSGVNKPMAFIAREDSKKLIVELIESTVLSLTEE
jgi:hypothetical protein